jgi:hypothetical protein
MSNHTGRSSSLRIRRLILTATAMIALAVPGLASAAGAATTSGSSLSVARSVNSASAQRAVAVKVSAEQAILPDAEKNVRARVACGTQTCGLNGTIEWGTNYLKIYGIVWGTSTNEGIVELEWTSGSVTYLKEPATAPNRTGVNFNKYYTTREPSYIQVRVCGHPIGVCSSWVDP